MSSYKALLAQRAELEAKIEAAREAEISAAVQHALTTTQHAYNQTA